MKKARQYMIEGKSYRTDRSYSKLDLGEVTKTFSFKYQTCSIGQEDQAGSYRASSVPTKYYFIGEGSIKMEIIRGMSQRQGQ